MSLPPFTLGVEEEFQIVDAETRELKSHIQQMFAEGEERLHEKIQRELHQSVIEIGSKVCADVREARHEVTTTRAELCRVARAHGLRVAAAGTHPFTHWSDVQTHESERYNRILQDLQVVARANVIFGLHIHVGFEDKETLIHVFNMARYFTPHIMALSVNSPFWSGRDTGWKSYLALPAEVFEENAPPTQAALNVSLSRFDAVAAEPAYRALTERQEFQTTHRLLREYVEMQTPKVGSRLNLPPPPADAASQRR